LVFSIYISLAAIYRRDPVAGLSQAAAAAWGASRFDIMAREIKNVDLFRQQLVGGAVPGKPNRSTAGALFGRAGSVTPGLLAKPTGAPNPGSIHRAGRNLTVSVERQHRYGAVETKEETPDDASYQNTKAAARSARRVLPETESRERGVVTEVLKEHYMFKDLGAGRAQEAAQVMHRHAFSAGTDLMVEGAPGDLFFVLVKGVAEVWLGDKRVHEFKERGAFGELALLNDAPRSATVCAETDVVCYTMDLPSFRSFRALGGDQEKAAAPAGEGEEDEEGGEETEETEEELLRREYQLCLKTLTSHYIFKGLPAKALKGAAHAMERLVVPAHTPLVEEGDDGDLFFVLVSGVAHVLKRGVKVHTYEGSGAFGELSLLAERATRAATVIAETEVVCYTLDMASFQSFRDLAFEPGTPTGVTRGAKLARFRSYSSEDAGEAQRKQDERARAEWDEARRRKGLAPAQAQQPARKTRFAPLAKPNAHVSSSADDVTDPRRPVPVRFVSPEALARQHELIRTALTPEQRALFRSCFKLGDLVTWKGQDFDIPRGTVGVVSVLWNDGTGDIEAVFEGRAWTFYPERLERVPTSKPAVLDYRRKLRAWRRDQMRGLARTSVDFEEIFRQQVATSKEYAEILRDVNRERGPWQRRPHRPQLFARVGTAAGAFGLAGGGADRRHSEGRAFELAAAKEELSRLQAASLAVRQAESAASRLPSNLDPFGGGGGGKRRSAEVGAADNADMGGGEGRWNHTALPPPPVPEAARRAVSLSLLMGPRTGLPGKPLPEPRDLRQLGKRVGAPAAELAGPLEVSITARGATGLVLKSHKSATAATAGKVEKKGPAAAAAARADPYLVVWTTLTLRGEQQECGPASSFDRAAFLRAEPGTAAWGSKFRLPVFARPGQLNDPATVLVMELRHSPAPLVPSELIGAACFPLSEARQRLNEEVVRQDS